MRAIYNFLAFKLALNLILNTPSPLSDMEVACSCGGDVFFIRNMTIIKKKTVRSYPTLETQAGSVVRMFVQLFSPNLIENVLKICIIFLSLYSYSALCWSAIYDPNKTLTFVKLNHAKKILCINICAKNFLYCFFSGFYR